MKSQIKLVVVIVLILSISSCFFKKKTYEYVSEHCHKMYFDGVIDVCIKGKLTKAVINTYTREGIFVKQYMPKDKHNWWTDTSFIEKTLYLRNKSLSTEYNWEVVLNDTLRYYISDFVLGIGYSCGKGEYHCYVKSCMVTTDTVSVRKCINYSIDLNKEECPCNAN